MNNYFCVLPFFGLEYYPNKNTHCCLLPNNYDINQLRDDILNKKRSKYCSACWNLEDQNIKSDRQIKNETFDVLSDQDINVVEENVRQGKYSPIMIKHSTSNTCNATCTTCGPHASTAWGSLEKQAKVISHIPKIKIDQTTVDKLEFESLISINFLGGEPLVEDLNFYILEKLIESNNLNCLISFTTNGSVFLTTKQKQLISKFQRINIGLSIDGTDKVFEYLRFPLKWKKLKENLKFFRTITNTNNITANQCISNLNILYHDDTVKWFESEHLCHHYNPVIYPTYFSPSALPNSVKQKICESTDNSDVHGLLSLPHTDQDDKNFQNLLVELQRQDQIKKINFKNYLPEFYNLITTNL